MENQAQNSIVTVMDRVPVEERAEMARYLTETMSTPGWGVFTRLLDQRVSAQRKLVEWPASLPAYEEMVSRAAFLRGLLTVQAIPGAVLESGERANEELRRTVAALEASL